MAGKQEIEAQLPADIQKAAQESARQEEQTALQRVPATSSGDLQTDVRPHYPVWPTSKQGPRATPPPPGMRPVNAFRPEQVAELDYNQATGEPSVESPARPLPDEDEKGAVSFDLKPRTGQETLNKRKQRL